MKNPIFTIFFVIFIVMILIAFQYINFVHLSNENKKLKFEVDSLQNEINVMNRQWDKQDRALDRIFNENPKIEKDFYEFFEQQTK